MPLSEAEAEARFEDDRYVYVAILRDRYLGTEKVLCATRKEAKTISKEVQRWSYNEESGEITKEKVYGQK